MCHGASTLAAATPAAATAATNPLLFIEFSLDTQGLPFALSVRMVKWIVGLVMSIGIYGVALLMAIENIILPLPSELIMPVAGFVASRGKMSLAGVIVAGTVGSVLGALPLFYLARSAGEEKMKRWVTKHGRWLLLRPTDLDRPKRWFARHAALSVIIGQIIPGVRGLIALPAGYAKMNVFAS